ncbi:hypothetical protein J6590_045407, partial [Homalodisca vitripennis]
ETTKTTTSDDLAMMSKESGKKFGEHLTSVLLWKTSVRVDTETVICYQSAVQITSCCRSYSRIQRYLSITAPCLTWLSFTLQPGANTKNQTTNNQHQPHVGCADNKLLCSYSRLQRYLSITAPCLTWLSFTLQPTTQTKPTPQTS